MVGNLVAIQFEEAQNWALGSAMAIVLILLVLATILIFTVIALGVRWIWRRVSRLDIDDEVVEARPVRAPERAAA
jgi:spermidine/putrescine transport system permease protein